MLEFEAFLNLPEEQLRLFLRKGASTQLCPRNRFLSILLIRKPDPTQLFVFWFATCAAPRNQNIRDKDNCLQNTIDIKTILLSKNTFQQ